MKPEVSRAKLEDPLPGKFIGIETPMIGHFTLDVRGVKLTQYSSSLPQINKIIKCSYKTDFQWFLESTEEQAHFRGKYVAISGGKIIAYGGTFGEALRKGRAILRDQIPLISYIAKEETLEV